MLSRRMRLSTSTVLTCLKLGYLEEPLTDNVAGCGVSTSSLKELLPNLSRHLKAAKESPLEVWN
jgi:hypothetical protein